MSPSMALPSRSRFASPDSLKVASKGTTFADGTMQFPGLAPGRYFVTASSADLLGALSPGIGDPQRSVNLKPGAREVIAFTFRRPGVIRGQVLTPTGRPVPGAIVEIVMTKSEFRGRPVSKRALDRPRMPRVASGSRTWCRGGISSGRDSPLPLMRP